MRTACALLGAVFLLSAGAARADETLLDLATVQARAKQAAAKPAAWRETIVSTSTDGLTTTTRHVNKGDDWRDAIDRGPFHTEQGEVKGEVWHQNDNGQTVANEPDPGQARHREDDHDPQPRARAGGGVRRGRSQRARLGRERISRSAPRGCRCGAK